MMTQWNVATVWTISRDENPPRSSVNARGCNALVKKRYKGTCQLPLSKKKKVVCRSKCVDFWTTEIFFGHGRKVSFSFLWKRRSTSKEGKRKKNTNTNNFAPLCQLRCRVTCYGCQNSIRNQRALRRKPFCFLRRHEPRSWNDHCT